MAEATDPAQLMQLAPMTREEISNLMACVDAVVRGNGLEAAETCLGLAAKLSAATPVWPGRPSEFPRNSQVLDVAAPAAE